MAIFAVNLKRIIKTMGKIKEVLAPSTLRYYDKDIKIFVEWYIKGDSMICERLNLIKHQRIEVQMQMIPEEHRVIWREAKDL